MELEESFGGRKSLVMQKQRLLLTVTICVVALLSASTMLAQDPDDATRRLWDTAFINSGKQQTKRKRSNRSYRLVTPRIPVSGVADDTVVGVTVWRLRRSNPADTGERMLVQEGDDEVEWLPERISSATKLVPGDRLRISVEAARTGYLYVIDREQYADGSLGEPHLIFPTTRTLNGDNSVKVGKLLEIPAQDDAPPYFKVRRSRPDHVGEVLSVFVTPKPLEELAITDKALKLTETQVAAWEKQWSTLVGSIELENGAGKPWTREEKQAAAGNGSAVLNAHAPSPQVVYYRPQSKVTEPIMVKVQLRYGPIRKL
jgi:hypothetical protein